jgi:hypothetical protein
MTSAHPPLFNFELAPLECVQPWGKAGQHSLHWFGLTDGQYWIQAGNDTLLEYSELARARVGSRYCNYQVVRLYEDVMEMIPSVVEPVPASLAPYLCGEAAHAWEAAYRSWYETLQSDIDEQRFCDLADSATTWIGNRTLDTGYLSPSAQIRLWSDPEHVYIGWDNSLKDFRGSPAWSAGRGSFSLPLVEFISEAVSFHDRLMEQMDARVKRVVAGALPNSVGVDLPGLEREHAYRYINDMNRRTVPTTTDWNRVRAAIAEIECAPTADP